MWGSRGEDEVTAAVILVGHQFNYGKFIMWGSRGEDEVTAAVILVGHQFGYGKAIMWASRGEEGQHQALGAAAGHRVRGAAAGHRLCGDARAALLRAAAAARRDGPQASQIPCINPQSSYMRAVLAAWFTVEIWWCIVSCFSATSRLAPWREACAWHGACSCCGK